MKKKSKELTSPHLCQSVTFSPPQHFPTHRNLNASFLKERTGGKTTVGTHYMCQKHEKTNKEWKFYILYIQKKSWKYEKLFQHLCASHFSFDVICNWQKSCFRTSSASSKFNMLQFHTCQCCVHNRMIRQLLDQQGLWWSPPLVQGHAVPSRPPCSRSLHSSLPFQSPHMATSLSTDIQLRLTYSVSCQIQPPWKASSYSILESTSEVAAASRSWTWPHWQKQFRFVECMTCIQTAAVTHTASKTQLFGMMFHPETVKSQIFVLGAYIAHIKRL